MKKIIFFILIVLSKVAYSQDTCEANLKIKYPEMTGRVTRFFHDNGTLSHKFINKNETTSKTFEWDSCGNLISKSKSGKTILTRTPYHKRLSIEYQVNGQIQMKRFSKTVGCWHIKKSWRKFYSEDGKRIE